MINYEPLWDTMRKKGISTYTMINKYGIPASTIHSLRHNGNINMLTLEKLCNALDCSPDFIVKFEKDTNKEHEK